LAVRRKKNKKDKKSVRFKNSFAVTYLVQSMNQILTNGEICIISFATELLLVKTVEHLKHAILNFFAQKPNK
jgi:hypothetical protein